MGLITEVQLHQALRNQQLEGKGRLGEHLVELGFVSEEQLSQVLGDQHQLPSIDLTKEEIDANLFSLIPTDVAIRFQVIPIHREGTVLTVAMLNPKDKEIIEELAFITGFEISPVAAAGIKKALEEYYGKAELPEDITSFSPEGFLDKLLQNAFQRRATAIHLEPVKDNIRVRFRIDNILYQVNRVPSKFKEGFLNVLKKRAEIESRAKSHHQGTFEVFYRDQKVHTIVDSYPLMNGDKWVIKLWNTNTNVPNLKELGLTPREYQLLEKSLKSNYGLIIICGPARSGLTSTLYTLVNSLNPALKDIFVLDEMRHYYLRGVNYYHLDDNENSLTEALDTLQESDADVIAIDKIMGSENLQKALDLSQRMLVIANISADNTSEAINYIQGQGANSRTLSSVLNCVIAQRLLRKICPHCKEQVKSESQMIHYKGKGCAECNFIGYYDMLPIFEIMFCSEDIRELITQEVAPQKILKNAIDEGMRTFRINGLMSIKEGKTTLDELRHTIARHLEVQKK